METFLGILIVIFLVLMLFGRYLVPVVQRWMMGKMEDRFRRMMGMPTRKEEKKQRKKAAKKNGSEGFSHEYATGPSNRERGPGRGYNSRRSGPIIPKEYAEDVEFIEIKSYSEEMTFSQDTAEHKTKKKDKSKVVYESQIEDVEFTEIKISDKK